jgi:serine/threonine-protein kinase
VAPVATATKTQRNNKMLWFAMVVLLAGVAAVATLVIHLLPSTGSIVVAVSGPGNRAVDSVQVLVDGKKQCDNSPCVANEVSAGTHFVTVKATGYATPAAQAVKVTRGDEAVLNLQLSPASEGTGIKVSAEGAGVKLFIDGKEIGPLPQELKDLSPGEHQLKLESNGRFETYEEKVTVVADQMKLVGPLKLKVLRGTAVIEAGNNADGAKVLLVTGREKRQIPKLPYKVDIDTSRGYQIVATKKGFDTLTLPVSFEAGNDQRQFTIELQREGEAASAGGTEVATTNNATVATTKSATTSSDGRKARTTTSSTSSTTSTTSTSSASSTSSAAAAGQGTLNINSIPQSNVLLDGRPLGKTPKAGVSVSAGSHTVVFIHPEHGRKQVVVTVIPGRTATAAVRFP